MISITGVPLLKILDWAKHEPLLATDPRFNKRVLLVHEDGSIFKWMDAFFVEKKMDKTTWIVVFTEHYGEHAFDKSEILFITDKTKKIKEITTLVLLSLPVKLLRNLRGESVSFLK